MLRLLIIVTCLSAISVGCTITREKQQEIKEAAGTVGTFLGLPRPVGEGAATLALAAFGIGAHKHGQRVGRKRAEKKPAQPVSAAPQA